MHYLPRRQWRGWSNRGAPTSAKEAKKSSRHPRRYLPLHAFAVEKTEKCNRVVLRICYKGEEQFVYGSGIQVAVWEIEGIEWLRCMETGFEVQLGGTGEDNAQHTYRKAKALLGSEAEDGPPTHQDANACDSEAEDDPPAHQACGSEAEDTHLPTKVPMRADEPWYVLVLAREHTTQPARVQSCAVPVVYEAPSPQTALAPASGKFSFGSRGSQWRVTD